MQTDTLFHEFFQLALHALFELWQITPGCAYRFTSPVVKASERRLDGLLEPALPEQPRYFLEVQGYENATIYWRVLHQVGLYHAQRPHLNGRPWQAVVLFLEPRHDPGPETLGPLEQGATGWLRRGVLTELLAQVPRPSPVLNALRPLAARDDSEVRQEAAAWLADLRQVAGLDAAAQARLLDIFVQLVIQGFRHLTRQEIEAMLQLTPIEETVVGQELIQEGMQQGLLQAMRSDLREVLEIRFGPVPEAVAAAIAGLDDPDELKRLLRRALTEESLTAFEQAFAED